MTDGIWNWRQCVLVSIGMLLMAGPMSVEVPLWLLVSNAFQDVA